jgi:uncharacterized protein (TIGR03435 family)
MFLQRSRLSLIATTASAASLIRSLEEQLGLKLQYEKTPVDVLVIDHAEKPSDN